LPAVVSPAESSRAETASLDLESTAQGAVALPDAATDAATDAESAAPAAGAAAVAIPTVHEGSGYEDFMILTVDKNTLAAELRTWPTEPTASIGLKKFRIAIGKAEGDKEIEGDNKTPEGVYFAQSHIGGQALPAKYGTMAIPLDFPNPIDQVAGKTGHGIWLHGVDRDERIEEAKVTEGCVAFYNHDIARLSGWLKGHQGVVVIARDLAQVNAPADLAAVREVTSAWMEAWKTRSIDAYLGHYAADFRYNKYDLKGYGDYKRRVFGSYEQMSLAYDNLRVVTHPKYAVSFFNQDFRGDDRFVSVGRKVLYWEKDDAGAWKIKREVFENRRFEFVRYTDAELAQLTAQAKSLEGDKDAKPKL
jgi:murein L,D-transpeptidase YafK